jgi:hypothetical protein
VKIVADQTTDHGRDNDADKNAAHNNEALTAINTRGRRDEGADAGKGIAQGF